MVSEPNERVVLSVEKCSCGECLETVSAIHFEKRQVFDIPEVKLIVREYVSERKICPACQKANQAKFPNEARSRVQYGSRIQGLATYLNVAHFIPLERSSEIINMLCGANISDGTIDCAIQVAGDGLEGFEANLKVGLQAQRVLHADETGVKVDGRLNWIHVLTCELMTFYAHHAKRGYAALESMDVLPKYQGTLMHAWSTYFQLQTLHALCTFIT